MPEADYTLIPQVKSVEFALEPVYNILESTRELMEIEYASGFGEWVAATAAQLTPEQRSFNRVLWLALDFMFYGETAPGSEWTEFPAYLDHLAARDPYALRDQMMAYMAGLPERHPEHWPTGGETPPTAGELLASRDTYLAFVDRVWPQYTGDPAWAEGYAYVNDPPRMLETTVNHLRTLWRDHLEAEWRRVRPMLEESAAAFQRLDLGGMTSGDVLRTVIGRDLGPKWHDAFARADHLIFVPSAHIGPYVVKFPGNRALRIVFGARLPRGTAGLSSALSRSELLVRLNALADDSRLRILELLTQHDELCAQDIIERLEMSQSSVSRHLSQLAATGYITERRREVAKCYSLNTDRVVDTLGALTNFLTRK